ncbi:energy transducer TonB [Photobacterium japonica]|uniref:energy transducer TonB n=1 Tax=Photobacterium japonica TaxID=2910235 RepID=UPI003D0D4B88
MKIALSFLCSLFVLTGCSSSHVSTTYLTSPPIAIEASDLNKYWISHENKGSFNIYKLEVPKHNGMVKIQYLIDSNGDIFNPSILEATPNDAWNDIAMHGLSAVEYTPAEGNKEKVPVIVAKEFIFTQP